MNQTKREQLNKQIANAQKQLNQEERTQVLARQKELNDKYEWMKTNKIQDVGQLEVVLSQVNARLNQLTKEGK